MTSKVVMYVTIPIRKDATYSERLEGIREVEKIESLPVLSSGDVKVFKVYPEYRMQTKQYFQFTVVLEPTDEQYDTLVNEMKDVFRLEIYNENKDYSRGEPHLYH